MFPWPRYLEEHVSVVHMRKRNPCLVPGCGRVYSYLRDLRAHMAAVHPNE